MKRALITGGAGSVGLALARHLWLAGWHVDLLDNFSRATTDKDLISFCDQPRTGLIKADLLDLGSALVPSPGYQIIFHCAAHLGVSKVSQAPDAVLRDNIAMTTAILDHAQQQPSLERFVFSSSSEVYAGTAEHFDLPIPTPEDIPVAITDIARPRTSYMLSKVVGEALCTYSGLPFTIVRPHNIYGPRMGLAHVIPQMLERAYNTPDNSPFDVYSVDHTRTFCFIDDAVEMITRAALAPACEHAVLNIGSEGPEITMGALAQLILNVTGRTAKIRPRPPTEGSPDRRVPDMSKCTELTGYSAKIGLEDGIRRSLQWYQENVFDDKLAKQPA